MAWPGTGGQAPGESTVTVSLVTLRLRAKVPRREAACQAARLRLRLSPGRVTVTVATESDRLNPTVATESDHHGISGMALTGRLAIIMMPLAGPRAIRMVGPVTQAR